jgi:glycosyltransferase involved in cell wall biosynthesis
MKIIYYSPHPHLNLMSPAGYGTHMREMITAFRNTGHEIMPVIMGGESNPPKESLEQSENNVKNGLKKITPKILWRTLKDVNLLRFDRYNASERLRGAIEEFKPDCIYERCNYMQFSGVRMAREYGLKHIMEINSPYVDQYNQLGKSRSLMERYARKIECRQVKETDLPLAMVGPLRDYFCERCDADAGDFLVTHDAFNKDNIQVDSESQQAIIEDYDLAGNTVIGYIGSIFEWHGLDKLIKAFDEMNMPDAKLLIVGYGEYMVNLTDLVKKQGREADVIFTGRVPKEDVFNYINIMDICAAPNAAWYQSPVKIFEYGAMGKPILGPDTKAVREIMEPEKDGVLVQPEVEDVKRGLKQLMQNPEEAQKLAAHFQQKVLKEYTWENNAKRVMKALSAR